MVMHTDLPSSASSKLKPIPSLSHCWACSRNLDRSPALIDDCRIDLRTSYSIDLRTSYSTWYDLPSIGPQPILPFTATHDNPLWFCVTQYHGRYSGDYFLLNVG